MPDRAQSVYCQDISGNLVPIPTSAITKRTALFGILLEGNKVLLLTHPETGLLTLPGGLTEYTHTFDQGLRQMFRAATGADTVRSDLILVTQSYHARQQAGIKRINLFFRLERDATSRRHFIDFDSPLRPQWIPLEELQRQGVQNGYDAILTAASNHS